MRYGPAQKPQIDSFNMWLGLVWVAPECRESGEPSDAGADVTDGVYVSYAVAREVNWTSAVRMDMRIDVGNWVSMRALMLSVSYHACDRDRGKLVPGRSWRWGCSMGFGRARRVSGKIEQLFVRLAGPGCAGSGFA